MRGLATLGFFALVACGASDSWEPGHSRVPMPPPGVGANEPRTCGSDLTCPLGFVCAKKAGAFTGDCARAVDENGSPVHVPHGTQSYGPGVLACTRDGQCPARFTCDEGRCVR